MFIEIVSRKTVFEVITSPLATFQYLSDHTMASTVGQDFSERLRLLFDGLIVGKTLENLLALCTLAGIETTDQLMDAVKDYENEWGFVGRLFRCGDNDPRTCENVDRQIVTLQVEKYLQKLWATHASPAGSVGGGVGGGGTGGSLSGHGNHDAACLLLGVQGLATTGRSGVDLASCRHVVAH